MASSDEQWSAVCAIVTRLRCWTRMSANDGRARWITDWSTLLTIPAPGYLEVGEGPLPIRYVDWVEVSTLRVRGGLAGRPCQTVPITEEILSALQESSIACEVRESTWSLKGLFAHEPVQVVRIENSLGPAPTSPS